MQVATMLADHKQIDKRATLRNRLGTDSNEIPVGVGFN